MQSYLQDGNIKLYMYEYLKLYWSIIKPILKPMLKLMFISALFGLFGWLYWAMDDKFGFTKVVITMGTVVMFYLHRIESKLRKNNRLLEDAITNK